MKIIRNKVRNKKIKNDVNDSRSNVCIVSIEQIPHYVMVFPLLTLKKSEL